MASEQDLLRIAANAAEQAAERTIHQTFKLLGVDIHDQEQLNEFRSDLIHARKMRRLWDKSMAHAFTIFLSLLTGGLIVAMWDTIKAKLHG